MNVLHESCDISLQAKLCRRCTHLLTDFLLDFLQFQNYCLSSSMNMEVLWLAVVNTSIRKHDGVSILFVRCMKVWTKQRRLVGPGSRALPRPRLEAVREAKPHREWCLQSRFFLVWFVLCNIHTWYTYIHTRTTSCHSLAHGLTFKHVRTTTARTSDCVRRRLQATLVCTSRACAAQGNACNRRFSQSVSFSAHQ